MHRTLLIALAAISLSTITDAGCVLDSVFVPESPKDELIRVEVDVLSSVSVGEDTIAEALELARLSLRDAGVEIETTVRTEPATGFDPLVDSDRKSKLLDSTRDDNGAIHLIVASRGAGAHGVVHYALSDATPRRAGLFVFADTVAYDFASNPALADAGFDVAQLLGRTIAHELGHAFGCPHETSGSSVMVQNSVLGSVTIESLPLWGRALVGEGHGHAVFSAASRSCLDVSQRLSVELSRPRYAE